MRRRARGGGGRQAEIDIERLGGRGDGVGRWRERPVYVAGVLPGERVRVRLAGARDGALRGTPLELVAAAPERATPPCPHFGACGGCRLQHLAAAPYRAWKQDLLVQALARRGIAAPAPEPLVSVPPGRRRRAALAAERRGGRLRLGFRAARSHDPVDLEACLVLRPELVDLLDPLRAALAEVVPEGARADLLVTLTENGPDVLLSLAAAPDLAGRERLAGLAAAADLARLGWRLGPDAAPEPVAVRRPPLVRFSGVAVTPPADGFLQPTAEGEAALVAALLQGLPAGLARAADLYAGCGAFTFALAAKARVLAVEAEPAAMAALDAAARGAGLVGRVESEVRDLARRPLTAAELAPFDLVVFDPPRAGARAQAAELAAARVPMVVAVSCNPHSFARDARILVDGGYRLEELVPIDQFPWTGHLELVARFRRAASPSRAGR